MTEPQSSSAPPWKGLVWIVFLCAFVLGMVVTFLAIRYGGIGFACERCPGVATPATECADRMNAEARECEKGGVVEFERLDETELGNESKRLVCKRLTRVEIRP
jgi:hypothetical protein